MAKESAPVIQQSFEQISSSILSCVDIEGLHRLFDLIPSIRDMFPILAPMIGQQRSDSPTDNVGAGRNRLRHLFNVLVMSICGGGYPLAIALDDLQWADNIALEIVEAFVTTTNTQITNVQFNGGLLLLGSYRDNEVDSDALLLKQINLMEQTKGRIRVTKISVKEMSDGDVNALLSSKLCLPMRYTHQLALVVHKKTRGHPFHVRQFLESIISNNMLRFSVKKRRWIWDEDVIDLQMISEGVAELLTRKLVNLSENVLLTLKIASCFGYQVNDLTMKLLNDEDGFSFDLIEALNSAVREGLMEKALYQYCFAHDILKESVYNLIPVYGRKQLHQKIGMILMNCAEQNPSVSSLAVDQMNMYSDDKLNFEQRSNFVQISLEAGKQSMASSSFSQARDYFEAAISLLNEDHWTSQYTLSLELYELSIAVGFAGGDIDTSEVLSRLKQILSNATSYEDTLNASAFLAKLLASSGQYTEAIEQCVNVLANHLGETFPTDIQPSDTLELLDSTLLQVQGMTNEQFAMLPQMTDTVKLNAMRFLTLLCSYTHVSKPSMLPIVSTRMLQLTLQYGLSDDTVVGLAMTGLSLITFLENIQQGYLLTKISSFLIEKSSNKHGLRAKLGAIYQSRFYIEPFQAVRETYIDVYKSCMMAGDVER